MSAFDPYNMREGLLGWVEASASADANNYFQWATASAPASGIIGLVRSFDFLSGQQLFEVRERGVVVGIKKTQDTLIQGNVSFAFTGALPNPAQANGFAQATMHWVYRELNSALGSAYFLIIGAHFEQNQFREGADENTMSMSWRALNMIGPTGSGYVI